MLPKPIHQANELLAFLLELVALLLLGVWGFHVGSNIAIHVLLGIGAPVLMAVVWGTFAAPRARVKLPVPAVLAIKAGVLVIAAVAGYAAGWRAFAIVFGVVALLNLAVAFSDRESLLRRSR